MQQEPAPLEVSSMPQLEAAAEEVRTTRRARLIARGNDALALLVPLPPATRRRQKATRGRADSALLKLARLAETIKVDPDLPTDISENKLKYLADIYAGDESGKQP